jgi:hypothetical protein
MTRRYTRMIDKGENARAVAARLIPADRLSIVKEGGAASGA